MTLWHGRFGGTPSESFWELEESYSFDHVLWRHDLVASAAHVRGLQRAGLVTVDEASDILAALVQIAAEFSDGIFVAAPSDEDIHTAIERRTTELAGVAGAKMHTARSRNDQVATALRLFVREALGDVAQHVVDLMETLGHVADTHSDAYLPGYTHLQRAQPVLLSHHLRAHGWALARDVERLLASVIRANVSPLGAGALAGTSLPIQPLETARELGFDRAFENSLDAVSDRDFVAEALFDVALLSVHCSRMGEELVLWTTTEFGFATLDDAYSSGSSMLPQKKNADVAELARGKTGRMIGNLTSLLVTLKGLPLSYNRDLQEDKEPLLDSLRQITLVVVALRGAYETLQFHEAHAAAAANDPLMSAVDVAEWLVMRGMPFRRAHEMVGALVAQSLEAGIPLQELVNASDELRGADEVFGDGGALRRRQSPGASGPTGASQQRDLYELTVRDHRLRIGSLPRVPTLSELVSTRL